MINGSSGKVNNGTAQAATTRSSANVAANASLLIKNNPTGQENRRPLLHRMFGTTKQPVTAT
jgi:hypothetical protein